ncbi:hypothetical protein M3221_16340 [Domibacillus indicus]|uniref:hypothetical protein n=1 Tax=Domibacillus indicus TaxID=1437523 RepID=UPI00204214F6|nr:hypothetical protein [Domibacillus indicus]MCM3789962.1 hypothetical protein [Domibacillus indicus]
MDEVCQADPLDFIWDQIVIQYTAIICAQKVMWVENGDDHSERRRANTFHLSGNIRWGIEQGMWGIILVHDRFQPHLPLLDK